MCWQFGLAIAVNGSSFDERYKSGLSCRKKCSLGASCNGKTRHGLLRKERGTNHDCNGLGRGDPSLPDRLDKLRKLI